MKRILLIATLCALGLTNAQEGTLLVQGSIGYINQTQNPPGGNDVKHNAFSFDPQVGYQFATNWTAGAEVSIYSSSHKSYNGPDIGRDEDKSNSLSAGAFVRYTKPLSDLFSFYADLGGGFINSKTTTIRQNPFDLPDTVLTTRTETKADGFYASLTPSLFINFKNGFGMNFNIGGLQYTHLNYENSDFSTFNVNFGQAINVGVSKNFSFAGKAPTP